MCCLYKKHRKLTCDNCVPANKQSAWLEEGTVNDKMQHSLEGNMSWFIIFPRLVNVIHRGFGVALPSLLKTVDLCRSDMACPEQLCFGGRNHKPRYKGSVLCKQSSSDAAKPLYCLTLL